MGKNPYSNEDFDTGTPDQAKEWIDTKVHTALGNAASGGMAVLASGFGKGLLVAAAVGAAAIIGASVLLPEAVPGLLAGNEVAADFTASDLFIKGIQQSVNLLLGHLGGLAFLGAGGAAGSLISVHTENNRIGKEAAQAQAEALACARARQPVKGKAPELAIDDPQHRLATGSFCSRLMEQQQHEMQQGAAR